LWYLRSQGKPFVFAILRAIENPKMRAQVTLTEKSWMPACAGMTGARAGGGRNLFIRDFNRIE
jgi:hypothetical protein